MSATRSRLPEKTGSTADWIADALRSKIIQGRYKANDPLRQDILAEQLGVSKIPLREALVQLKAEGLVAFMPKRGAVVSPLSADEVQEIYTMRIALETVALEKAILRIRPADLIRARGVLEIIDGGADKTEWGDLNWEFHATLYRAARMPLLLNAIQRLHNNVLRYLIIYLDSLSAAGISQNEHWAILEACREKNVRQAISVLKRHLAKASGNLVSFLS
ncbi:transcription regulator [Desulfosarcina alkanivorans]|jgi:DNA-binding GntR family transcriptional regulator|uniref:Transcription regulator n=1 Tax=Desulfosarcina alkanivorans TaxID=571177 RepID=A0A5K7YIR1_9BACT|nr:GntR family transcriptional regulator [Desulfosarcina alkanivorans]BBO68818.1 transcription regulator [Desulfosarcina alkanivorans]